MSVILDLLTSKPAAIAYFAAMVALGILLLVKMGEIETLSGQVKTLTDNYATEKANVVTLTNGVNACNKSVEDLKSAGDARTKAANDALAAETGNRKAAEAKAAQILKATRDQFNAAAASRTVVQPGPVPPAPTTLAQADLAMLQACRAADGLILESAR
jgi:hypothetical protein